MLLYHPADPVHNMFKDLLELEMKPTLETFLIQICYAICLFVMSNTFSAMLLLCVMINALVTQWISLAMPKTFYQRLSLYTLFGSKGLRLLTDQQICWVFRCSQILCNRWNFIFAGTKISMHFASYHVIVVALCYLLIRYSGLLLFHNAIGIIIICTICILACILCCRYECSFIGEMVDTSRKFKQACIRNSLRTSWIYKAAKSFPTIMTSCTFPFFVANNATYLDFWNHTVNHIVELLCLH